MGASEITTPVAPARSANAFDGEVPNADGNFFANDGHQLLVLDSGSVMTKITIVTACTIDTENVDDKEIDVTSPKRYLIGPFPPAWYNDDDGYVQLAYTTGITGAKVAVITLT